MTKVNMRVKCLAILALAAALAVGQGSACAGSPEGVTFSAVICDADAGDPIAGAFVTADGSVCAISDHQGHLVWSRAIPIAAELQVFHGRYIERSIVVPISATAEAVSVTMTPCADSGVLRIQCVSDNGDIVANAHLFIHSPYQPTASSEAYAGPQGCISVRVPSGRYWISGVAGGYSVGTPSPTEEQGGSTVRPEVAVRSGEARETRIVFDRLATIDGRIEPAVSSSGTLNVTAFTSCRHEFPGCGGVGMRESIPIQIDKSGHCQAVISAGRGVLEILINGRTSYPMSYAARPGETIECVVPLP